MPFKSYIPDKPKPKRKIRKDAGVLKRAGIGARPGRLVASEKSIIDAAIASNPGELVPAQIEALAIITKKEPSTIARHVEAAKEKLQLNAEFYVDSHRQVVERALASSDPKALETARKASEFAMEKVSAKDSEGREVRIVDAASSSSSAPTIKIGIALGGMPGRSQRTIDTDDE